MLFSTLCSFLYFFVLVKSYRKKKKKDLITSSMLLLTPYQVARTVLNQHFCPKRNSQLKGTSRAINFVVTLQTTSEKFQTTKIQKDMDLTKVTTVAKSMEMAHWEAKSMNPNILQQPTHKKALDAMAKQQIINIYHIQQTTTQSISLTQVASQEP